MRKQRPGKGNQLPLSHTAWGERSQASQPAVRVPGVMFLPGHGAGTPGACLPGAHKPVETSKTLLGAIFLSKGLTPSA